MSQLFCYSHIILWVLRKMLSLNKKIRPCSSVSLRLQSTAHSYVLLMYHQIYIVTTIHIFNEGTNTESIKCTQEKRGKRRKRELTREREGGKEREREKESE